MEKGAGRLQVERSACQSRRRGKLFVSCWWGGMREKGWWGCQLRRYGYMFLLSFSLVFDSPSRAWLHTSIDYRESPLCLRRDKYLRKRIVQVSKVHGTQARDTGILVCLLNDLIFCSFILLRRQSWASAQATPSASTGPVTQRSSKVIEVGDVGCGHLSEGEGLSWVMNDLQEDTRCHRLQPSILQS